MSLGLDHDINRDEGTVTLWVPAGALGGDVVGVELDESDLLHLLADLADEASS